MTTPLFAEARERVLSYTALGLQLWDPLTGRPAAGLDVTARLRAAGRRAKVSTAFTTPSHAYAFRGLEGMARWEMPDPDHPADPASPSVTTSEFVVAAVDPGGRFLPMVVTVDAPHPGLVTLADVVATSVPTGSPVFLFPSVSRALPGGTAAVRMRLAGTAGTPLPYARVEVVAAGQRWVGVSDERGQAVVAFPWPTFGGAIAGSPAPGTAGTPSAAQSWPVTVSVRSDVGALDRVPGVPSPGAEWPTLASLVNQPARALYPAEGAAPAPTVTRTLQFGRELVVATANQDEGLLLVDGVAP